MGENRCNFCNSEIIVSLTDDCRNLFCDCSTCGKYIITTDAAAIIRRSPQQIEPIQHLISGYIREMNELGLPLERIIPDSIESILRSSLIPKTLQDRFNKVLLYFYRKNEKFGQRHKLPPISISYSKDINEAESIINALHEINIISNLNLLSPHSFDHSCTLTPKGFELAEKLLKQIPNSRQVFVAMRYIDAMETIYESSISKAITDAGFNPLIMYDTEFNDSIFDQTITAIRKSRFMVADFTEVSPNVYFEAGFAYGLGITVIYTCQKNFKDKIKFDIQHNNFIFWENGEELFERLKNRITRTII